MAIAVLFNRLRRHWQQILVVHLIFTLAGFAILTPLFTLLLQGILALTGTVAVMDQDIALLLLSPVGMIVGVLLISLMLALAGLELGALQCIAQASQFGQSVSGLVATRYSATHAIKLLHLTTHLTLRVLLYLLPVLAAGGLVAWQLLSAHDINYYLSEHPPEFMLAVAVGAVLMAVLVWLLGRRLLGWSLALPLMMFNAIAPGQTFKQSEQLVAGNRKLCLRALLGWVILALLLATTPLLIMKLCMTVLLGSGSTSLIAMAMTLGLAGAICSVIAYLVTALNLAGFTFVIAELYQQLSPELTADRISAQMSARTSNKNISWSPGKAVAIMVVILIAEMAYLSSLLSKVNIDNELLVIAHRGAAGAAPENTMAAINRAIADGTDWVEIDVQETRDGAIIVLHDSDFMKLSGNPLKVWEGDLSQIQQIDIGSWFGPQFAGERVPTLADVLAAIKASEAKLVIELKYYGHDEQLEQRVIDIVETAGMADRVAIMSLKLDGVLKLKALRPQWTAGLLAVTAVGDITRLDVDFLAVNQSKANGPFIRKARAAGKSVFIWTVNDALSMSQWMSMGVDGIITDEPALAKNILAQRAELRPVEQMVISAALFFGQPEALKQYRDNSP